MNNKTIFTAESVTKGHPDKFCDLVSDMILDDCLKLDPEARVACETYATKGLVVVGGEITTTAKPDYKAIVQAAAGKVGYDLTGAELITAVNRQSPDIAQAVDKESQGAGDQGIMIGYATNETPEYLPTEYAYARRITDRLSELRESGEIKGIGSDGKSQVSAEFEDGGFVRFTKIVVSIQHTADKDAQKLKAEILKKVIGFVFRGFDLKDTEILINPSGRFILGGIDADTGLTGRKIVADAYGPRIAVGGGAFSGKDASKVDRSAAYYARYVSKNIVASGTADKCQVSIAYAIGKAEPLAVGIDTFGTGAVSDEIIQNAVMLIFNFAPAEIIKQLDLKQAIYTGTASGGHLGKDFTWERSDKADEIIKLLQ